MKYLLSLCLCLIFSAGLNAQEPPPAQKNPFPERVKAPEGILDGGNGWLNSSSDISLKDLRGKIVVLDFWTYCCINCMHVLPDLKFLEEKYGDDLVVIGVHSAKFSNEKDSENIRQAIMRYEISHPVVNDSDMTIWKKFGTRAWPTLAIIDPEGYYLGAQSGEGHRELFDTIIARLVKFHKAKGTLDQTPIRFDLERDKVKSGSLRYPGKVLADETNDRIFIADTGHNRIIVTNLKGELKETIGRGAIGLQDGKFAEAEFDHPQGMSLVGDTLYVADTENHAIRAIDLKAGTVTTLAGTGKQARSRQNGGKLRATALNSPWALQHLDGILFVAMAGPHQLWQHVLGTDSISVYAGSGAEDVVNGPLKTAALAQPSGIATDGAFLYVVDSEGSAVRKVSTSAEGTVETLAGTSELPRGQSLFAFGDVDGVGSSARLQHPLGIALKGEKLFVADSYNHKIRTVHRSTGKTESWLGDGTASKSLKPVRFSEPGGLAVLGESLLIADTNNHRILITDLATKATRELVIAGLAAPKLKPKNRLASRKPVLVPAQTVRKSGEVLIDVTLTMPEGFKINKEMPITWQLVSAGDTEFAEKSVIGKVQKTTAANNHVQLKIPVLEAAKDGRLTVSLRYGFCKGGDGGLCRIVTNVWTLPITLSEQATLEMAKLTASTPTN